MYSLFDMNHFGIRAPLAELVPLLVRYGIGGVHVPAPLLDDRTAAAEASRLVLGSGLKWGLLPTPVDFYAEDVDDGTFAAGLEKLKVWAEAGEQMGVKYAYNHVWNGSNTRPVADNYAWLVGRIRQVWRVLHESGIQYGLEFLGPWPLRSSFKYPFFHTLSGVLALADAVDPSCGFVFDSFHWYCGSNADPADAYLAARHVDRMANYHVNDGRPGRTYQEQQDLERALPLETGVIDAAMPYRLFKENGYRGPVMCEPMMPWSLNADGKSLETIIKTVAEAYQRLDAAAVRPVGGHE